MPCVAAPRHGSAAAAGTSATGSGPNDERTQDAAAVLTLVQGPVVVAGSPQQPCAGLSHSTSGLAGRRQVAEHSDPVHITRQEDAARPVDADEEGVDTVRPGSSSCRQLCV